MTLAMDPSESEEVLFRRHVHNTPIPRSQDMGPNPKTRTTSNPQPQLSMVADSMVGAAWACPITSSRPAARGDPELGYTARGHSLDSSLGSQKCLNPSRDDTECVGPIEWSDRNHRSCQTWNSMFTQHHEHDIARTQHPNMRNTTNPTPRCQQHRITIIVDEGIRRRCSSI